MAGKDNKNSSGHPVAFTERQLDVLRCWADSPTIAKAAVKLQISENTMQTLLKRMRKKLKVRRTFDVYRYAKDQGLL